MTGKDHSKYIENQTQKYYEDNKAADLTKDGLSLLFWRLPERVQRENVSSGLTFDIFSKSAST